MLQRDELDTAYASGVGDMFDLAETRRDLQAKRTHLRGEVDGIAELQKRFAEVQAILKKSGGNNTGLDAEPSPEVVASAGRVDEGQ